MARRSPLASTLRRLDKVESVLFDDAGERRGGVLCLPEIMYGNLDAWERLAMRMQAELRASAAEDVDSAHRQAYVEPLPDALGSVIEGGHFHRPDPNRRQDAPMPPKRQPLPPVKLR